MMRVILLPSAFVVALGLVAACTGTDRRGPPATEVAFSPAAARGQQSFMLHCNQCHPRGQAAMAPGINNKPLPGWLIAFQVRNGLGAMPAFDRATIPEDELEDLVTYLIELRRGG
jgi:mono/diheme cytochrome c family protein